jgi:hypothetical protein
MKTKIINLIKNFFSKKQLLYICITILKVIWFHILTTLLIPFVLVFLPLSLINHKYFWDKIWCDVIIDKLYKLGLIPMFYDN